jgi:GH15 family glucan-1,4-alpha-glucosidase
MQSIALVGINGSIDFLCYPEFDSPTVFAALLDDQRGGRFEIRPQIEDMRVRQLYLPDTNILLTRFLAEQGVAELTDYMPIQKDSGQPNQIVRIVSVITGNVKFKMSCQPRFNYAASDHELQSSDCCATFFPAHKDCPPMSLYSSVAIETRSQDISAEFSLQAGESATFVLGGLRAEGEQPEMDLLRQRFLETAQFWKTWVSN